jgi:transcriptional regulator with XRE-family HTH domain
MQVLGEQLRRRARELDLTNAEVARRAGLSPRRYGNYVTGDREPDLQTLVRICKVLMTTPDQLLGFDDARSAKKKSERDRLIDKLLAKQPSDRFATADEAAQLLEQCLAHVQQPSAVPLPTAVAQICRARQAKGRRTPRLITASLLLVLATGSAATYFMTGQRVAKSPAGSGSTSTNQPIVSEESLSTLEWDSTAQEIEGLTTDINALQQKADQLWDNQPILTPPHAESPPNNQPIPEVLP